MDQKAYVGNIDPAEIKHRRKTPEASVTEQENIHLWGMQWPCTQTDAKRACAVSMLQSSLPVARVGTLMKSNRTLKEMKLNLVDYECTHIAKRSWLWWSGQMQHGSTGKTCPQRLVSFEELRQHESCKAEDMVRLRFLIVGKSKQKTRSSLSAEVQAVADAEKSKTSRGGK